MGADEAVAAPPPAGRPSSPKPRLASQLFFFSHLLAPFDAIMERPVRLVVKEVHAFAALTAAANKTSADETFMARKSESFKCASRFQDFDGREID
jgi:hypothetical protein